MELKKIKVVHISTSVNGGAGSAAYRIHLSLLHNNIDSHFLCLDDDLTGESIKCSKLTQAKNKINTLLLILELQRHQQLSTILFRHLPL